MDQEDDIVLLHYQTVCFILLHLKSESGDKIKFSSD